MLCEVEPELSIASLTMTANMLEANSDKIGVENEIHNSVKFLHNILKDQQNLIDKQNRKLDAFELVVEEVKLKNNILNRKVRELEIKLKKGEQYLWGNAMEIKEVSFQDEFTKDRYVVVKSVQVFFDFIVNYYFSDRKVL